MILPHFEHVLRTCKIRGWQENHSTLTLDREGLASILRELLRQVPFDEAWYIDRYPDVAEAVAKGRTTAIEHYVEWGYFEGRLPGLGGFDGEAYCQANPDIAHLLDRPDAVEQARDHFVEYGYREGRPVPSGTDGGESATYSGQRPGASNPGEKERAAPRREAESGATTSH